jgi:hypothetical protein
VLLSDRATWVAVGLAVGADSLALAAALDVLLVVVRGRRSSFAAVEQLLRESLEGTEGLHADLATALDEARAETRRARELGEIATRIDLDAVLARTLEAAGALSRVQAGLIRPPSADGTTAEPLAATLQMSTDEAARQPVAGPGGQPPRAVRIAYTYTHEELSEGGDLIRGGFSIPLRDSQGEPIGVLAAFWRGEARDATDGELASLELAAQAGPGDRERPPLPRGAPARPTSTR